MIPTILALSAVRGADLENRLDGHRPVWEDARGHEDDDAVTVKIKAFSADTREKGMKEGGRREDGGGPSSMFPWGNDDQKDSDWGEENGHLSSEVNGFEIDARIKANDKGGQKMREMVNPPPPPPPSPHRDHRNSHDHQGTHDHRDHDYRRDWGERVVEKGEEAAKRVEESSGFEIRAVVKDRDGREGREEGRDHRGEGSAERGHANDDAIVIEVKAYTGDQSDRGEKAGEKFDGRDDGRMNRFIGDRDDPRNDGQRRPHLEEMRMDGWGDHPHHREQRTHHHHEQPDHHREQRIHHHHEQRDHDEDCKGKDCWMGEKGHEDDDAIVVEVRAYTKNRVARGMKEGATKDGRNADGNWGEESGHLDEEINGFEIKAVIKDKDAHGRKAVWRSEPRDHTTTTHHHHHDRRPSAIN